MENNRKNPLPFEREALLAGVRGDAELLNSRNAETRLAALERLARTMHRDLPARVRRKILPHLERALREDRESINRAVALIGIVNSNLPEAPDLINQEILRKPAYFSLTRKALEEIPRLRNPGAKRRAIRHLKEAESRLKDWELVSKARFAINYLKAPEPRSGKLRGKIVTMEGETAGGRP